MNVGQKFFNAWKAEINSRLKMIKDDKNFNQTQTSTKEITWTALNLNSLPGDVDYSLDSPPFNFQDATWCLRLYPNHCENRYYYIGLYIVRLSSLVPHHRLQYHLKSSDTPKTLCVEAADFDENHKENGDMKFTYKYDGILPKNIMKVICQISCCGSQPVENAYSQTDLLMQHTKNLGDLCQNFKNLLLNGQDRNVILKVKDKEFRAHGDILRVRSPVFEPMLSHDMIEKNSGVIDIPDCDPGAFEQFLFYLYSGEVERLDADNMLSVYYVADKYDTGHLKEVCREFIKESLTCANVSDVIQLALGHSDALLLECATEYFMKEMRSVLPTVEWQSFMKRNPTQANELIIKATEKLYAGKI